MDDKTRSIPGYIETCIFRYIEKFGSIRRCLGMDETRSILGYIENWIFRYIEKFDSISNSIRYPSPRIALRLRCNMKPSKLIFSTAFSTTGSVRRCPPCLRRRCGAVPLATWPVSLLWLWCGGHTELGRCYLGSTRNEVTIL